ncbi:hypothetical protein O181_026880 [Austropuccinia psidii MF-1]|uniref:G-patch domain-containing protein n=1 Tax=Austropuccinia psidii MF-1 TaxID=1389203 RepID=A0A9Q3H2M3_9BASI|nr:hypothetical protein [Austropuccinia psidii MF-1]
MSFKFGAFSGSSSAGGGGPGSSSNSGGGGGLYAGISLGGTNNNKNLNQDLNSSDKNSIGDQSGNLSNQTDSNDPSSLPQRSPTKDNQVKKDDDKSKASSWSSSLRFAPVIRKQPAKSASKPFAVPFSTSVSVANKSGLAAAAFAPEDDNDLNTINPTGKGIHIPGRAKLALTAHAPSTTSSKPPSVFARKGGFLAAHAPERIPGAPSSTTSNAKSPISQAIGDKVDSNIPGFQHSLPAILAQTTTLKGLVPTIPGSSSKVLKKKLDQPPSLTLPEDELGTGGRRDVNGFAETEAGRKLALKAARNSKKSKKKGKTREVDPAILFMEDYDPARPNDYNEWMNFVKRRREMRREAIRLERERQRRQERQEMTESSYYSSDDDGTASDEARPPRGNFFAPPPEYHEPINKNDDDNPSTTVPFTTVSRTETGDEAYARRVALSQGIPYQPPQNVPPAPVNEHKDISPEATPTISIADAQARAKSIAERLQKVHGSTNESEAASPVAEPNPSEPPLDSKAQMPPTAAATLLEAQAKAKLIAAKLAALNGANNSSSSSVAPAETKTLHSVENNQQDASQEFTNKAPGQPDFARRLMDKYGWKEGQGLGATESGRTSILTVATAPVSGNKKRKNNSIEMGAGVSGPMMPSKTGIAGKGRGVVLDEAKVQRDMEEKIRYGEPTRVVYLTNVVSVDEVDDELATEIAEEAHKHGIVERCFVRIVQRPVDDPAEAVRVFILYSGLVGAWKAVKTFDGRFFGGRNIRARFFSENNFTLGDWDA